MKRSQTHGHVCARVRMHTFVPSLSRTICHFLHMKVLLQGKKKKKKKASKVIAGDITSVSIDFDLMCCNLEQGHTSYLICSCIRVFMEIAFSCEYI